MLGIVPFYVILGAHNLGIEPLQNHKNVYVSCMHVYLCYSVVSTIYVCMYIYTTLLTRMYVFQFEK
jgi:hypothetical protein